MWSIENHPHYNKNLNSGFRSYIATISKRLSRGKLSRGRCWLGRKARGRMDKKEKNEIRIESQARQTYS